MGASCQSACQMKKTSDCCGNLRPSQLQMIYNRDYPDRSSIQKLRRWNHDQKSKSIQNQHSTAAESELLSFPTQEQMNNNNCNNFDQISSEKQFKYESIQTDIINQRMFDIFDENIQNTICGYIREVECILFNRNTNKNGEGYRNIIPNNIHYQILLYYSIQKQCKIEWDSDDVQYFGTYDACDMFEDAISEIGSDFVQHEIGEPEFINPNVDFWDKFDTNYFVDNKIEHNGSKYIMNVQNKNYSSYFRSSDATVNNICIRSSNMEVYMPLQMRMIADIAIPKCIKFNMKNENYLHPQIIFSVNYINCFDILWINDSSLIFDNIHIHLENIDEKRNNFCKLNMTQRPMLLDSKRIEQTQIHQTNVSKTVVKLLPNPTMKNLHSQNIIKQHRKNVSKVIDKLLMNRPSINHLYAQNIMKNEHRNINKQQFAIKYIHRSSWKQLNKAGILFDSNQLQQRQQHKRNASNIINNLLIHRPTLTDLYRQNIMKPDGINRMDFIAEKLKIKLNQRPSMIEIIERRIYFDLQEKHKKLNERKQISYKMRKFMSKRPTERELKEKNILITNKQIEQKQEYKRKMSMDLEAWFKKRTPFEQIKYDSKYNPNVQIHCDVVRETQIDVIGNKLFDKLDEKQFKEGSLLLWNQRANIAEFMNTTIESTRIRLWDKFDKKEKGMLNTEKYLPKFIYTMSVLHVKSANRQSTIPKYSHVKDYAKYMSDLLIQTLPNDQRDYIDKDHFVDNIHIYLSSIC